MANNLYEYIGACSNNELTIKSNVNIIGVGPLCQSYFGSKDDGDCFLVSLINVLGVYSTKLYKELYNDVLLIAIDNNYFSYSGVSSFNQFPFFKKAGKPYSLKANSTLLLFTSWKKIKKIIDDGTPIILSMYGSDGRGYYKAHSVTICGYREVEFREKTYNFLKVRDNWNTYTSYIDFNKLPKLSSCLFYYEKEKGER